MLIDNKHFVLNHSYQLSLNRIVVVLTLIFAIYYNEVLCIEE